MTKSNAKTIPSMQRVINYMITYDYMNIKNCQEQILMIEITGL